MYVAIFQIRNQAKIHFFRYYVDQVSRQLLQSDTFARKSHRVHICLYNVVGVLSISYHIFVYLNKYDTFHYSDIK